MIVEIEAERLLVVSDLHLGNPVSTASRRVADFLELARRSRTGICINGDGFDLLQGRLSSLIASSVPVLAKLRRLRTEGLPVYYVTGNHDVVLEHVLEELPVDAVAPFFNLRSGPRRIRLEHGHVYDPFFVRFPDLYEILCRVARPLLFAKPDVYKLWASLQRVADGRRRASTESDVGTYPYYRAARMLFERGFDVVVFGHTHKPELLDLGPGLFVNCGDWMKAGHYARIDAGEVTLEPWVGGEPG